MSREEKFNIGLFVTLFTIVFLLTVVVIGLLLKLPLAIGIVGGCMYMVMMYYFFTKIRVKCEVLK